MRCYPTAVLALLSVATSLVYASGPADAISAAYADVQKQPTELRHSLRYFSLYAIAEVDRKEFVRVLNFHCNSLSREGDIVPLAKVTDELYRVNLLDYGWSRGTWEKLATVEPYFHLPIAEGVKARAEAYSEPARAAPQQQQPQSQPRRVSYDGGRTWVTEPASSSPGAPRQERNRNDDVKKVTPVHAPWLPTADITALAIATNSDVPVVRADWFIYQTAIAQDRVAGYYDWLGLGNKEADFQELIGADVNLARKVKKEIAAAVARSGVTLNNRSMERFATITGAYWRTQDFKTNTLKQNTLRLLDGDTEPPKGDASEQYGVLPNGLFAFWLQDANGNRQNTAPDFIASDKASTGVDSRVHIGLSCIRCHTEGIRNIDDWVRRVHSGPIALANPDYEKFKRLRQLYLSDLEGHIRADQQAYAAALARLALLTDGGVGGWTAKQNADAYGRAWQIFADTDLTVEDIARELGVTREKLLAAVEGYAKAYQGKAEPMVLSLLAKDAPAMRREHMEEVYGVFQSVIAGAK